MQSQVRARSASALFIAAALLISCGSHTLGTATNLDPRLTDPRLIDPPIPYPTPSLPSDTRALASLAVVGISLAQCRLGRDFDEGKGEPRNSTLAREWLTRSAMQNDGCGLNNLGNMYHYGDGVSVDYALARKYWEAAALTGYASAYYNLGTMYEYGQGTPVDEQMAIDWLTKAGIANYGPAFDDLGNLYAFGHQVKIHDVSSAVRYFRMAVQAHYDPDVCDCAAENRADAAENLAYLYLIVYHGDDRLRYNMILQLLRSTSTRSWSQYEIGEVYLRGAGVKKNLDTAAAWFKKSADQGYAPAASIYASYLFGVDGRPAHPKEALAYLREAIDGGDESAMYELAVMTWTGHDVPRDKTRALELMTLAASNGSMPAIIDLASRYYKGDGVLPDRYKAYILFNVAVDIGGTWGPGLRQKLERQLTKDQIRSARFEIKRLDQSVLTAMDEQTDLPPIPSSIKSTD
jgi:TPR repeat protein